MEKTYKRVPFDIELAKKIQSGEVEGRIVNRDGCPARIICLDPIHPTPQFIGLVLYRTDDNTCKLEKIYRYSFNGIALGYGENYIHNLYIELPEEIPNLIDTKSLYDNWQDIQNTLNDLFREKANKNNAKFSDELLVHYAADLFTWFRETHLIFKFRLDKLEELKQYAEEHIMEPSWCYEAKQNIEKIFGLETQKHGFKVGDVVTFLEGELKGRHGVIREINSNENISVVTYSCDVLTSAKRILKVYNYKEKHEFKPFDKVLVRNKNKRWYPRFYAETDGLLYYTTDSKNWEECIPYEGNEHLVGTTDKPKEDQL